MRSLSRLRLAGQSAGSGFVIHHAVLRPASQGCVALPDLTNLDHKRFSAETTFQH
jgi:hypothetical protein